MQMFRESDSAEERDKLAYAIGASRNPVHIQYALEFSLSDEVRRAHTIFVFSSAVKTKVGKELAWTFFKENFHIFEMRYVSSFTHKNETSQTENEIEAITYWILFRQIIPFLCLCV